MSNILRVMYCVLRIMSCLLVHKEINNKAGKLLIYEKPTRAILSYFLGIVYNALCLTSYVFRLDE